MQQSSDHQQRQSALDLGQSFIVQAPAGSGKTELLIQRFLKALSSVQEPEQVLAITFTKKAASEMKERVSHALKDAAAQKPPVSDHQAHTQKLAKAVLRQSQDYKWNIEQKPHRLMIMTIDALCQSLLSEPLSISQTPTSMYQKAAYQCCLHFLEKEHPAFGRLLIHLDHNIDRLLTLFEGLLTHRDQWLPLWHTDQPLDVQMHAAINMLFEDATQQIQTTFPNEQAELLQTLLTFTQEHGLEPLPCSLDTALLENHAQSAAFWQRLSELLLTQSGELRKKAQKAQGFPPKKDAVDDEEAEYFSEMKNAFENLQGIWQEAPAFLLALRAFLHLPNRDDLKLDQGLLADLSTILPTLAALLNVVFTQTNQYDFIHVALEARFAAEQSPWPCCLKMHFPISHLLIDEFQDTSQTQFQLFSAMIKDWQMGDGNSIFMVGDPMQSIYRFRQADVALFYQTIDQGIANIRPNALYLTQNFRSTASIIEWNNTLFASLFAQSPDPNIGAVPFHASTPMQPNAPTPECHWLEEADDLAQTDYLCQHIAKTQQAYPTEHIAVLLRSRQKLGLLLHLCEHKGICVQGQDIIPLGQHPVILDLLTLMHISFDPYQKLHWLALLRSPFCGLDTQSLYTAQSYFRPGIHGLMALEALLKESDLFSDASVIQRIACLTGHLQGHFAKQTHQPARAWLEQLWHRIGGPTAYAHASDTLHVASAFFTKLELSAKDNPSHPTKAMQHLLKGAYTDRINPDATVHIMTLHKAKGLEFNHVYLPFLEGSPPPKRASLFSWHTLFGKAHKPHTLFTMIPEHSGAKHSIHRYSDHLERQKETQERLRLLYVGATRAKTHLHLVGSLKGDRPATGSLQHLLWPGLSEAQKQTTTHETPSIAFVAQKPYWIDIPIPGDQTTAWQSLGTSAPHKPQTQSYEQWLGILIHHGLYLLSLQHTTKPVEQILTVLWQQALNNGIEQSLTTDACKAIKQAALGALQNTLNDEKGQWLLKPHHDHQSECPIYFQQDGSIKHCVIDRTFKIDGTRWIIDYKTTWLENDQDLLKAKVTHQEQLHTYAALFDDRAIELALYFPRQGKFIAWSYQADPELV